MAFISKSSVRDLDKLFFNDKSTGHHYGLDGPISTWVVDHNNDGLVDESAGDEAYLYVTMRRGGNNVYAFNITDPDSPEIEFIIEGGITTHFENLGQSWSRMVKTKIFHQGAITDVLLFGGGYDTHQDTFNHYRQSRIPNTEALGSEIYMVNAKGNSQREAELIWSSVNKPFSNQLIHSIPSDIKAIDINGDAIMDQFYVGDLGGQIWRFDIHPPANGANVSSLDITGGVIADLSSKFTNGSQADSQTVPGDSAHFRRFFNAPDLSIINRNGVNQLALSIGSGYRAHPNQRGTKERFYTLFLTDFNTRLRNYTTLVHADLYNATVDQFSTGNSNSATYLNQLQAAQGWYLGFDEQGVPWSGEKVLADSYTYQGHLYFTTYSPARFTGCSIQTNALSKLYRIELSNGSLADYLTGQPDLDLDGDADARSTKLETTVIPPAPQVLFHAGSNSTRTATVYVGVEGEQISGANKIEATYWVDDQHISGP